MKIKYVLFFLLCEKIVQHVVVTIALYFNVKNIAATAAVTPGVLMISGAIAAGLFMLSLWGMIARKNWAINLVIALALFDILGEFVAQGRFDIVITVSFIVAIILLVLGLAYRRKELNDAGNGL
jgi:hypothetical protein